MIPDRMYFIEKGLVWLWKEWHILAHEAAAQVNSSKYLQSLKKMLLIGITESFWIATFIPLPIATELSVERSVSNKVSSVYFEDADIPVPLIHSTPIQMM